MQFIIDRYNLNISQLQYNLSNKTRAGKKITYDHNAVIQEMISILGSEVLKINLFAVNKKGKYIYKNDTFCELVGEAPCVTDPVAWEVSLDVMKKGKRVVVEENYCGTYYMSIKAPLRVNGEVGGLIGISIDITNEKRAEKLELQNSMQQEMKNFTEQVAHDIRSPLAVLSTLAKICDNLSEKDRLTLQSVVGSINDIANDLLNKYKECDDKISIIEEKNQNILVDLALQEVINHKINQYSQSMVSFNYVPDLSHKHTFIRGNASSFSRMISNLVNNAVEALQNKEIDRKVTIDSRIENRHVKIGVRDSGVGMTPETVDRIKSNIPIDSSKEGGHGIGLKQIYGALQELKGAMCINSTEGVGTSIVLTIPIVEPPIWFVDRLMLRGGDLVVVLDDDLSVHHVWRKVFKNYEDKLSVKYFEQGQETIDFINSFDNKSNIFLLSDYELRNHGLNGIDVIKKTSMQKQSIIVTNGYNQKNIQNFSEKTGVKILPKPHISDTVIVEVSI
jgi:nitrogen-specific signal transduction histidine kinase